MSTVPYDMWNRIGKEYTKHTLSPSELTGIGLGTRGAQAQAELRGAGASRS